MYVTARLTVQRVWARPESAGPSHARDPKFLVLRALRVSQVTRSDRRTEKFFNLGRMASFYVLIEVRIHVIVLYRIVVHK